MRNDIDEIVNKIATNNQACIEHGVNTLTYHIDPQAQIGEEILRLYLGDYLTTYTVSDNDIVLKANIVKGKQEIQMVGDTIAHITATLYHDALKPYLSKNGTVPVAILPRAIREFFDTVSIRLSTDKPEITFNIIDKEYPDREPKLPSRIQRIPA